MALARYLSCPAIVALGGGFKCLGVNRRGVRPIATDGNVFKAGSANSGGVKKVSAVHQNGDFHDFAQPCQVDLTKFFPLREYQQGLRSVGRFHGGGAIGNSSGGSGKHLLSV